MSPAPVLMRKTINYDIEALRGFAALFVVWCHTGDPTYRVSPGYLPSGIFSWVPLGHFCVLLFFVLSGYVIGISTKKPLTLSNSGLYLKKRLVRLMPILLITLGLALLASQETFDFLTIVGNAALLQGILVTQINLPAWSLHYEMLYYLLFIPVSIFRVNPYTLTIIAFVVAILNYFLYAKLHTPVITAYGFGFIYWLLGLGLSRSFAATAVDKPRFQVLLGCLLLVLCVEEYNLFSVVLRRAFSSVGVTFMFPGNYSPKIAALNLFDLSYLPFALIIIITFIGKRFPYRLLFLQVLAGICAATLLYHVARSPLPKIAFVQPALYTLFALVCLLVRSAWLENAGRHVMRVGIWLGSLSYGIYLAHFPVMLLFGRITAFSNTWQYFIIRVILFVLLSVCLGYILEKVIQPRVKNLFLLQDS